MWVLCFYFGSSTSFLLSQHLCKVSHVNTWVLNKAWKTNALLITTVQHHFAQIDSFSRFHFRHFHRRINVGKSAMGFSLVTCGEIVSVHRSIKSHMVPSLPRTSHSFSVEENLRCSLQTILPCWLCDFSLFFFFSHRRHSSLRVMQASIVPRLVYHVLFWLHNFHMPFRSLSFDIGSWWWVRIFTWPPPLHNSGIVPLCNIPAPSSPLIIKIYSTFLRLLLCTIFPGPPSPIIPHLTRCVHTHGLSCSLINQRRLLPVHPFVVIFYNDAE